MHVQYHKSSAAPVKAIGVLFPCVPFILIFKYFGGQSSEVAYLQQEKTVLNRTVWCVLQARTRDGGGNARATQGAAKAAENLSAFQGRVQQSVVFVSVLLISK